MVALLDIERRVAGIGGWQFFFSFFLRFCDSRRSFLADSNLREVTRSATSMNNGYRWYVTFLSGDGKVDRLVPDGAYLGGQDAVDNLYDAVLITTHKEQVTTHDITGTFKIHLGEERTSALPFDCTSGAMEEALLLLDGVARIDVTKRDTE